eukprot:CAMPEP_0117696496 /NCGR_PEP_ID=MMETSP0804-20121206/28707_1 /TAXON_ID=1074897 /ORGANISM="Tetraselmis astigmatica, Strain CCMP880" /LENGTH=540 /DNA_ID=CAMNT_0005510645 /DNA_START=33 /DNA_END=1655 /DNA_ORIENTATION=-
MLRTAALAGFTGIGALTGWVSTDEGAARSVTFWYHAAPIYLQYRLVQLRAEELHRLGVPGSLSEDEANIRYEDLHNRYASYVRDVTYRMRGFYLKNAQYLSVRDDFLPKQYLDWCKETQDAAPAELAEGEAWELVKRSLRDDLGLDASSVFREFDSKTLGAASIGQVHCARLAPEYGGKEVVVKVQAPGIERRFRADIQVCIAFCKLAMPQHVEPLKEVERSFMTEFDYRSEAANMAEVRRNITPRFGRRVALPFVMERLPGTKLADGLREAFARYAKRTSRSAAALEAEQVGAVDVQSGRSLAGHSSQVRWANRLQLASDCLLSANPLRLAWNLSPGALLLGRAEYRWSEPLPDLGGLVELLLDVHAAEVLDDGVFNADPHPGNILLMPDGRLGLLDYGQTKRLPLGARLSFAKLLVALCVDDRQEVARLVREDFGGSSKRSDDDITWRLAAFWLDRDTEEVTGKRNLQEFLDWCEATDPLITTADNIVMVSRVSMLLRGMANAFGLRLRVAPAWRSAAEDLLRRNGVNYPLTTLPTVP